MRSEDEIRKRIELAEEGAEESYKCGNYHDTALWNSYAVALEWVLQEDTECQK